MTIRKGFLAGVAIAALALAGCGSHSAAPKHPLPRVVPTPSKAVLKVHPCNTVGPPCSAITPEGAPHAPINKDATGPVGDTSTSGPTGTTGTTSTTGETGATGTALVPLDLAAFRGSAIHINTAGVEYVSHFENNFQRVYCPYWDPYGRVWSRAYGETDFGGNFGGRCITHAQAVFNLGYMLEHQYLWAVRALNTSFTQNQVNSLASFVWNLGAYIFQNNSGLRFAIQHHNPYPLLGYDIAGGQVLSALVVRRHSEVALFLKSEAPPRKPTRGQLEASIRAHERVLVQLRKRKAALVHALVTSHCKPHSRNATCKRWVNEAYKVHLQGIHQDAIVHRLKQQIARHDYSA